jgi:hypothetical protein
MVGALGSRGLPTLVREFAIRFGLGDHLTLIGRREAVRDAIEYCTT